MSDEPQVPGPSPIDRAGTRTIILLGLAGLLVWFGLFGLGLFINSASYRDQVLAHPDVQNLGMSILTYTPTNVGLICLAAAFIGGCTSRMQAQHVARKRTRKPAAAAESEPQWESDSEIYRSENPASSLLRGFAVYGAYLAGSYVAAEKPFIVTSPELYAQAAGTISLAAFTVGFDPTFLYSLIGLKGKSDKPS